MAGISDSTLRQSSDSIRNVQFVGRYGVFAPAASGSEEEYVLENEKIRITFSNKGGRVTEVLLKHYQKILLDETRKEYFAPLYLLEDEKNTFEYLIPVGDKLVRTGELFFEVKEEPGAITFTARGSNGAMFRQSYVLGVNSYAVDYDIALEGMPVSADPVPLRLSWTNYLDRIEKNTGYEKYYTSVYYRELDSDSPDYCSCRNSDTDDLSGTPLKWISHSNQFFNASLIADERFTGGVMSTEMMDEQSDDLKILRSELNFPTRGGDEHIGMTMYMGPNDFEELRAFHLSLEDIIPFGSSIFGTINRWVIRPLFNMLSALMSNKGLVILLLTLLVKILLYPLTYKMLYSQAKMSALKPQLASLREKYKDDMQKQQMETMKVYREYGVSPLGGCLPMVAQMPIWFALYRFFPASIEFRQAKFLWATDLSSYDVLVNIPFEIPFYGAHISMFTLLWAATTVMYTYYSMKHMDLGAMGGNQKMLQYMQYLMPVFFLFFFNNYASGLTLYLLFSNLVNIGLTLGTKEFIFDEEKIKARLAVNKEKPKKRSAFSERLEQAMKEQQRVAQDRSKPKSKR